MKTFVVLAAGVSVIAALVFFALSQRYAVLAVEVNRSNGQSLLVRIDRLTGKTWSSTVAAKFGGIEYFEGPTVWYPMGDYEPEPPTKEFTAPPLSTGEKLQDFPIPHPATNW